MSELESVDKTRGKMPPKENVLMMFGGFPIMSRVTAAKQAHEVDLHACGCTDGKLCPICGRDCHHEPAMIETVEEKKKRKRYWAWLIIPLIFLLLLLPLAWLLPWDNNGGSPKPGPVEPGQPSRVCFEGGVNQNCCNVQLSVTREEQLRGLRFLNGYAEDGCMLYILGTPDKYQFWSKDMNFPIDIILISPDRTVLEVNGSVPPCHIPEGSTATCPLYGGKASISYGIEANGGWAAAHGIANSDRVTFEY